MDGVLVNIHADIHAATGAVSAGTSNVRWVGWPDSVNEVRERVRAATRNSGLRWPDEPVTVGMSPAFPSPATPGCDLAVACAVQAAIGNLAPARLTETVLLGELALDGSLRPVRGVLPALLTARRAGITHAIVPRPNLPETTYLTGIEVHGVDHLSEAIPWLHNDRHLPTRDRDSNADADSDGGVASTSAERYVAPPAVQGEFTGEAMPDLGDIAGQPEARWALEVAAAGRHHLLLVGEPGSGTTLYARCLPGLLPALTEQQALEVTAVHSLAGTLTPEAPLITRPPFVTPHHSDSAPALLGGGAGMARPGAISRAHHGVLFLDDAAEFDRNRLESLRTALEEGEIRVARRDGVARFPSRFQLVMATLPCPCGQSELDCACSPQARRRYRARLSGPLLDRIDLRVRLRPTLTRRPAHSSVPEGTAVVRARVQLARQRAAERWASHGAQTNAEVPAELLRREFGLPRSVTAALDHALDTGAITKRGADRCLAVSWTLADLAGLDRPGDGEVTAALAFR